MEELRQQVHKRARECCEYCLLPEQEALHPHQLDHLIPRQHGGADTASNLALSCVTCNRYKGPNLATLDPETGALTGLYNPRLDTWDAHFQLEEGAIMGLTAEGRATVTLLRFNDHARLEVRRKLITQGRYPSSQGC